MSKATMSKAFVNLPERVFRQAQTIAAAQHIPVEQLFVEAITERVRRDTLLASDTRPLGLHVFGSLKRPGR
jgi:hypothetical protein